jgi:hypothetical protein
MRLPHELLRDQVGDRLRPPPGFAWAPGGVHRRGARYDVGRSATSFLLDAGTSYYVDPARPNNTGNGLTPATAKRDIWAAIGLLPLDNSGVFTIWVKSGVYTLTGGWSGGGAGSALGSRCNVIATANLATATLSSWEPGTVRTTVGTALTWSLVTGAVYKATLAAAPYAVVDETDLTAAGRGTRLTLGATAGEVEATPGTWRHDTGEVFVHLHDGRAPDADVHVLKASQANGRASAAAVSMYIDGLDFVGGSDSFLLSAGTAATFHRSRFLYGQAEGLDARSCADVRLYDCDADENTADGLAYTTVTRALEVRCRGRRNGHNAANINNGSSMHSGGAALRLAGEYTDNEGPNVADVQDSKSWLLDCTISGTRASSSGQQVNFWSEGQAYLERCRLSGNTADLRAHASGDVINLWSTAYATAIGDGLVRSSRG